MSKEYNETQRDDLRNISLAVTTPWSSKGIQNRLLWELSAWFDCPIVPRDNRSILQVCQDENIEALLVADFPPKLYHRTNPDKPVFFHPGMAMQRILRLRRGESDRLLEVAGIRSGDRVFDATLGAGADTLVFAEAVGDSGRVIACEAIAPLARVFSYAIQSRFLQPDWLAALLGRIDVEIGDHLAALRALPDNSVDVVYFDPMFQEPLSNDANVESLRAFADFSPLRETAVEEARRVARRRVVVKDRPTSHVLQRFGFEPDKNRAHFVYGVLRLQE